MGGNIQNKRQKQNQWSRRRSRRAGMGVVGWVLDELGVRGCCIEEKIDVGGETMKGKVPS